MSPLRAKRKSLRGSDSRHRMQPKAPGEEGRGHWRTELEAGICLSAWLPWQMVPPLCVWVRGWAVGTTLWVTYVRVLMEAN
jgi:hypothetical protein